MYLSKTNEYKGLTRGSGHDRLKQFRAGNENGVLEPSFRSAMWPVRASRGKCFEQ